MAKSKRKPSGRGSAFNDHLPRNMVAGPIHGANRTTLSALRRLERAARIARGERPKDCVLAFNAAESANANHALRRAERGTRIRIMELHPTKGMRSRSIVA